MDNLELKVVGSCTVIAAVAVIYNYNQTSSLLALMSVMVVGALAMKVGHEIYDTYLSVK